MFETLFFCYLKTSKNDWGNYRSRVTIFQFTLTTKEIPINNTVLYTTYKDTHTLEYFAGTAAFSMPNANLHGVAAAT